MGKKANAFSTGSDGAATPSFSSADDDNDAPMENADASVSNRVDDDDDEEEDGGGTKNNDKRKRQSPSAGAHDNAVVVSPSAKKEAIVVGAETRTTATTTTTTLDDAGSSRLFQPHRSLGLLTAAASSPHDDATASSGLLFRFRKGKFHLQPSARSSEETFVTIPLGERFQIVTLSKLVPVLVSRALPPSAAHHRRRRRRDGGGRREGGDDAEEMHRAFSDSSLSVTVATHGPGSLGRAVSVTLYSRTRPLACLDAFPFLADKRSKSKEKKKGEKDGNNCWGIVDMIPLGKQRVAMGGEKEGRMENALLFAIVCARSDENVGERESDGQGAEDAVEVVGNDSEDESESGGSDGDESGKPTASTRSDSTSEDDDESDGDDGDEDGSSSTASSFEDKNRSPAKDCYGRVLIVRATRINLEIIKTIDLDGSIGSNFIPHVGLHPATYVNKILLGGRPAADSLDEDTPRTSMLLLNVRSGKMIHSFQSLSAELGEKQPGRQKEQRPSAIAITALEQSPAVDTVAVGTSDGSVHLVNLLHDVSLFTLRHKSKLHDMNVVSSISFRTDGNAARQGVAPLAAGCADGSVSVWDLTPVRDDDDGGAVRRTLLTKLEGVHRGSGISDLAYLPGEPLLLSTGLAPSNSVALHVFDAPDHSGRVLRSRAGHAAPPRLVRYLHPGASGGGVLANASDGTDASSCQILSCGGPGDRSLRLFSTARSNLDKEYSQGQGLDRKARKLFGDDSAASRAELLLPEVEALAACEARSRDWGDLVTVHRDHAMAYVWSTQRGAQSGPVLRQPGWNVSAMKERPPRSAHAKSLAISACGNFALVGTRGGVVYKYNLQSGLPRGSFPRDAASSQTEEEERRRKKGLRFAGDVGRTMRMLEKKINKGGTMPSDPDRAERDRVLQLDAEAKREAIVGRACHTGAVVGIAVDSLNRTVVTAGADAKLVLWNFATHMPHRRGPVALPAPATKLCHVRDSDLAAIAMTDYGVVVFDCSSLTIVRYFGGSRRHANDNKQPSSSDDWSRTSHTGPISDLNFGPDGRKLFTSSLDGTIRVWDVPTGLCVDWMSFSSPPTSVALSPTGEFLATSHVGRLGISLWCDKSFFRMVLLDGAPSEPARMNEPCPVAECEREEANDAVVSFDAVPSVQEKKDDDAAFGNGERETRGGSPPRAKGRGLVTLSGLPPAHWKNLFHLELVKERNKPIEAPKKPPQAPFFLQWRTGLESGTADDATDEKNAGGASANGKSSSKDATDGWDAAWSDDDAGADNDGANGVNPSQEGQSKPTTQNKRRKVAHHRSKLAELLQTCFDAKEASSTGESYSDVTSYLSKMGPSSIDVEISSLCYGIHDLEEGLPLLHLASAWLLEACGSRQSFEAVNAYLHRFLHVHGNVITRMDRALRQKETEPTSEEEGENEDPMKSKLKEFIQTIAQLREKQQDASNMLQGKMQHTICLLRHLSRMV